MVRARDFLNKQVQLYMSNWQYALLYTLILTVFPYTSWMAVSGISLLTLRKGFKSGATVLFPVAFVSYALSLKSLSHWGSLINTLVLFAPSFIGALILRLTSTWQAVVAAFFLATAAGALLVQLLAPDFIIKQYAYLESILLDSQADATIIKLITDLSNIDKSIVASYAFGLQLLSISTSAMIALVLARALQSSLYNVGGFMREALNFRANKIAIFIMFVLFVGVNKQNTLAMILLPSVFMYFLLSGLSICAGVVNKKSSKLMLVTLLPIAILPVIGVPFYSFLGLFDSIFSLKFFAFKRRKRG